MLVYLHSNYDFPDLLHQTPHNNGQWGEFQFTTNLLDKCDYIVVLNQPTKNIHTQCLKGGKIIITQEPPYERNSYLKLHFRFYDTIISAFKSDSKFKIINSQAALPWHIGKNYDELMSLVPNPETKKDKVSWITSNNNFFPQHKIRLDFIDYLKNQRFEFDLFGRGFSPIKDKFDGIYPYKYTIAAENYIANDYFTEKIIDAYLSWSMPIYAGCPNITNYFPAESMIKIDLNNPEESLDIIKNAVENKLWDKNIDAIKHARELVLNKYQLFPMLSDFIKNNLISNNSTNYVDTFVPSSGLTRMEEFKKRIRNILHKK